jgi:IS30 family transposase
MRLHMPSAGLGPAVLSMVERTFRLTRLAKLPHATVKAVRNGARQRLRPVAHAVRTITADPGRESAAHRDIAADV